MGHVKIVMVPKMSSITYNLHNLVKVSFTKDFSPKFIPEYFKDKRAKEADLTIDERRDLKFDKTRYQCMEHFHGGGGSLYFERSRYGIFAQKMLMSDLFGEAMLSFTRFTRVTKIVDIVTLIGLLLEIKLLQRDHTLVHGAGVSKDGKGYLISGWGGTGKTSTLIALSREGFKLLGDEIVLLSKDGFLYSFPRTVDVHPGTANVSKLAIPRQKKVKGAIKHVICRLSPFELPLSPGIGVELSKIGKIEGKAKLDGVFLLEKSSILRREKISKEEAIGGLVGMNKLELFGQRFPLKAFVAYCHLNNVDPLCVERQMEEIFKRAFTRCYSIKGSKTQHYKLIMEELSSR